ncbi:unnamed protein product [Effrenium voratum]|nr:unnamed protein product [Effrenium voratum]
MPGGAPGAANGANPFAPGAGGANPFGGLDANNPFDLGMEPEPQYQAPPVQPTDMPTAPTVGPPPPKQAAVLSVEPAEPPAKRPPPRSPPPVVDADVVFLD